MTATIHALNPKTTTVPQVNVSIPAYLRDVADKLEQGKIKPLYNVILVMVDMQGIITPESALTVRRDQIIGDLVLAQYQLTVEK